VNAGALAPAVSVAPRPDFAALLADAIRTPGRVHAAYTAFHGYSASNQMLALIQCLERGLQPGPMTTFPGWKTKGRHVTRGARALSLWQPVTVARRPATAEGPEPRDDDDAEPERVTRFLFRPRWFVLAQTEGADVEAEPVPGWDRARALAALDVREIPFDLPDGNAQGFARGRAIAVSPVAALPAKTTFHELAHVRLGHTADGEAADGADLPRTLREVEAEGVALLCLESLDLPGAEYARGYMQRWLGAGEGIPETSARRIFKATDAILRAGG
jgi:hypothetical protein